MIKKHIPRLIIVTMLALILMSIATSLAATNTIPSTRLGQQISTISPNTLKPPQCSPLTLTTLVVCTGGNCDGTGASELIIGTSNGERIRGRGGSDCILGGGGDDNIIGSGGADVCIGGPGNDTFTTCETTYQ